MDGTTIPFTAALRSNRPKIKVFQYYADQNFVDNGSFIRVASTGGTAKIWDIIYFIQKTQSYA